MMKKMSSLFRNRLNLHTRQGKMILCGTVLVLAVVLAVIAVCYLPVRYHQKHTVADYFRSNQRLLRAESMQPGGSDVLRLNDVSIGPSSDPLLEAASGELQMKYHGLFRCGTPDFTKLTILDAPIQLTVQNQDVRLNGIPAADFLRRLTEQPVDPSGNFIPLEIRSKLYMPNIPEPTELTVTVETDGRNDAYLLRGKWFVPKLEAQAEQRGTWELHYQKSDGTLTVATSGMIALHFLQEILLRSKEPDCMASWIDSGEISGIGNFSATLPDFAVSDLSFTGTLNHAVFSTPKLKLRTRQPADFTLRKSGKSCSWNVPELLLSEPFPVPVKKFNMERAAKSGLIQFSLVADLKNVLGRTLYRQVGMEAPDTQSLQYAIQGKLRVKDRSWEFQSITPEAEAPGELTYLGNGNRSMKLEPTHFEFSGHGKGAEGSVESLLEFQNLALQIPQGSFQLDRGSMQTIRELGDVKTVRNDNVEIHWNKLSGNTPIGIFETLSGAGELTAVHDKTGKINFRWVSRGNDWNWTTFWGTMKSGPWQSMAAAEITQDQPEWQLSDLSFTINDIEVQNKEISARLSGVKLSSSGNFAEDKLRNGEIHLQVKTLQSETSRIESGSAQFRFALDPQSWTLQLTAGSADFARSDLGMKRPWSARNLSLLTEGEAWDKLPKGFRLAADTLELAYLDWQGDFQNSKWEIHKDDENNVQCHLDFESLHARSPENKFGRGSFGQTALDLMLKLNADNTITQWQAKYQSRQPAWAWDAMHFGAEECSAEMTQNVDKTARSDFRMTNAALLEKYISVLAPEVKLSLAKDQQQSVSGMLAMQQSTISSPDGKLELQKADLSLPLCFNSKKANADGTLTAERVRWNGIEQGKLQGTLTQHEKEVVYRGTLTSLLFSNADVQLASSFQAKEYHIDFTIPDSQLAQPLVLHQYCTKLPGTILSGKIAASGKIDCSPDKFTSSAQLSLENSNWQFDNATAEGVSAKVEFNDLAKLTTAKEFPLVCKRFQWKGWELSDTQLNVAMLAENRLGIGSWQSRIGDGRIKATMPLDFSYLTPPEKALDMPFEVKDIPLEKLLSQLGIQTVHTAAKVSGNVHASYLDGALHYQDSSVHFASADGEILRMEALQNAMVRMSDPAYQEFLQAVLKAVRCKTAQFDFTEKNSELFIKIKVEGTPVEPVPFVYQGSRAKTPFRPAVPGETGFSGDLDILFSLRLNAPGTAVKPQLEQK